jgi:proteasome lid subunit RPN8/RPN11
VSAGPRPLVRMAREAAEAIRTEAARAYPHEGCGALLGADAAVSDILPLANAETSSPRTRFTVSPLDYLAAEDSAEARGLRLLGFWHSHPDHPARPSPTDRAYAWPGLLTLVIGVERGSPGEMTAWDVPGQEEPFRQLDLQVEVEIARRSEEVLPEVAPRKEPR